MKAYIATRLERHADHNALRDALAEVGIGLSYDWSVHGPVWRDGLDRIKEVSCLEMDGVAQADVVIVLLPGGRGTHAELGMALATGKPVILNASEADHEAFFGAVPETCAFYHHPLCYWTWGLTWDELAQDALRVARTARADARAERHAEGKVTG